ncbi:MULTISPECIES: hypothetical protein [unclassified Cryobacterium]|uniref:hypothetical protein n=1 Tax=unclassified Cryobacterium TaxID=2649013 RepID=UPI002AB5A461|nr:MULTISPECIES: hypothetical protein [unclassified Cryobacterium]MDY7542595.1 hypothetical protein [Cryobacterium sp. 5B3]MEB0264715.1 hypothetical protein [Cryobacterium sp. 10I5]MEB0273687.1 hypothetical protein [Cryobacterium sp. 5B3]
MTFYDEWRDWMLANRKPIDKATWDQMCGSGQMRFNSARGWSRYPTKAVDSAQIVANNSGDLNEDRDAAPVAAWHFFSIAGINNGHVGQGAKPGGGCLAMMSATCPEMVGLDVGFSSVQHYLDARPAARYLGWSTNYAGGLALPIDGSATAGLNEQPVEEDDMFNDSDRALAGIATAAVGRIEVGVYALNKKVDSLLGTDALLLWATTDSKDGLRQMVAVVQTAIAKIKTGTVLSDADLAALEAVVKSVPTADIAAAATATADEIDRRALERLSTDKASVITSLAALGK